MATVRGDNPTARWGPRDPALNYMETSVTATLTLSRAKPVTHAECNNLTLLAVELEFSRVVALIAVKNQQLVLALCNERQLTRRRKALVS